ncbi:pseudoazurin [Aureimonas leprariae]|uniref:Pseudoazurin n=1 Tax=Plantimonas leprariae TaxID=2615207 RepID=A0A7V7PQ94_9HYPH|nr:pseudoazurin [Aureimonas leprariae]KAB0680311.1 pseudoazurin [Aureimonas leprariae]
MKSALMLLAALPLVVAVPAIAADHQVKMVNKGAKGEMVFEPDLITAAPGDTVTFIPTDAGHLAETMKGMVPAGGKEFKGKAGKPVTMTVDAEGVYGIKCQPHYSMGMVALVVAGKPTNLAEAKAVKQVSPKAKARLDELFAEVPSN